MIEARLRKFANTALRKSDILQTCKYILFGENAVSGRHKFGRLIIEGRSRHLFKCRRRTIHRNATDTRMTLPRPETDPIARYLHLTRAVLPALARADRRAWPVENDHCFQRIVLDTLCGGVWYDHLRRPAYKHLTPAQAARAVQLCEDLISGTADIRALNQQSLRWRGKR